MSAYESLVDHICDGYEQIIYEYTNDLTCRLFLQRGIEAKNKALLSMTERIERADKKLKAVLIETKECIHGDYPKAYFWFWGVPGNSEELSNEARKNKWI